MKYAIYTLFATALLALSGCNTVVGAGKDVWGGARYVTNAVLDSDE